MLNINGLKVNTAAIAEGLYRIICQQNQEAIVAFGMLPADIMAMLEKLLRQKIISIACEQMGVSERELNLMGILSEDKIKETMRPIIHEVTVGIFAAAKNADALLV